MYAWIWRKLPGGVAGKITGSAVLIAAAVLVLFLWVFPWAGPKLPFNHVTVDGQPTPQPTSTAPAVPN
jgi:hypothetical protein